jgi:iron uptake system EfeUOB component EfeO/EfeM
MNAQNNIETNPVLTEAVLNVDALSINPENQVAGKKRDMLNAKINSKIKGEVDLFLVADRSEMC